MDPFAAYDCHRPAAWMASLGLCTVLNRYGADYWSSCRLSWRADQPQLTFASDDGESATLDGLVAELRRIALLRSEWNGWPWLQLATDPDEWESIPDAEWKAAAGAWERNGRLVRGGRSPLLMSSGNQNQGRIVQAAVADAAKSLSEQHFTATQWNERFDAGWLGLQEATTGAYRWDASDSNATANCESAALWLAMESLVHFPCEVGGSLFTPPLLAGEESAKRKKTTEQSDEIKIERLKGTWATNALFESGRPTTYRLLRWSQPLLSTEIAELLCSPWLHGDLDADAYSPSKPSWIERHPTIRQELKRYSVTSRWSGRRYLDSTGKYWRLSSVTPEAVL